MCALKRNDVAIKHYSIEQGRNQKRARSNAPEPKQTPKRRRETPQTGYMEEDEITPVPKRQEEEEEEEAEVQELPRSVRGAPEHMKAAIRKKQNSEVCH